MNRSRGRPLLAATLLALLTVGAFHGLARNSFLVLDDPEYLTGNEQVRAGLTARGVAWALATTHTGNWHPLTWISHMLDVELFGMRPGPQHLVSLAIHTANALLAFTLLRGLTGALWRSALAAALFAVHPLHVESVAWASERKDVLSTLLTLLAALAWLRTVRARGSGASAAAALLFALALMAKPMPVTLPFLLLVLDWWPLGRWSPALPAAAGLPRSPLRLLPPARLWLEKLPLFALSAAVAATTLVVQHSALASTQGLPMPVRIANALVAYAGYLGKTLWPFRLSVYYPHPGSLWPSGALAAAVLTLAAITCWAARCAQRRPHLLAGWLWYLGTLAPVIGVVQAGSQSMADRYTYLPLVGVFIMAAWTAAAAARQASRTLALVLASTLLSAGLAARTADQVALWRDDESLFGHALLVDPANWMAHNALGSSRVSRGDTPGAIPHYREALRLNPGHAYELRRLGAALLDQGQVQEAVEHLLQALALEPGDVDARVSLGNALEALGRSGEALEHYRKAAALDPGHPGARYNLGLALAEHGDLESAVLNLREAVRLSPEAAEAHSDLGLALASLGKFEEAKGHYLRALAIDPGLALAHNNLGSALAARGRYREARDHFLKALEIQPGLAQARQNLARLAGRGVDEPPPNPRGDSGQSPPAPRP